MQAVFAVLALFAVHHASAERVRGTALNKVMDLMDNMQTKIKAEGVEADKVQTEKKEYCRSTKQDTNHNIDRNTDKIQEASAALQKANAEIEAMKASIVDLASQIAHDTTERDDATALRKQQNADFNEGQKDLDDTIDALVRAAGVLRKAGLGGTPLKAALMQVTQGLAVVMDAAFIDAASRTKLQSMLQAAQKDDDDEDAGGYKQPQAKAYESHSGDIINLIAELKIKAEGELSDLRKEEMNRQHEFDLLKQGLEDSIHTGERDRKANQATLNANQEIKGKSEGILASEKGDKATNEKYLADTTQECDQAGADYAASSKSRGEELAVLAKAEGIIRETYKASTASLKAGGRAGGASNELSFLQEPNQDARSEVVLAIKNLARKYRSVALAQLASHATSDTFGKIKGLVRDMIARLQKQAAAEADHNAYCNSERKENREKRDDQQQKLNTFEARLESANANEQQLKEDVSKLSGEVSELDSQMAEATKIRQQEQKDYANAAEGYRVGNDGLSKAIGVLRDYFAADGDHEKKSDSATGIVAMLETAVQDMANTAAQEELAEKNAQRGYDKMMQEGKISKASKEASMKGKTGELARLAELINDVKNDVQGMSEELNATLAYLEKLKGMCEHKPQSFADRAAKMQAEIAGLKQAQEILDNETALFFLQRK